MAGDMWCMCGVVLMGDTLRSLRECSFMLHDWQGPCVGVQLCHHATESVRATAGPEYVFLGGADHDSFRASGHLRPSAGGYQL